VSDIRFTMIGIGLIFAGFIVLGVFGTPYATSTLEAEQFGDCYEYFDDKPPVPVSCEVKLLDKSLFFGLVVSLIGAGIFALIKGIRGKWDQDVKPQDMVGPGGENPTKSDKDEK
jgi:hypothetical protein